MIPFEVCGDYACPPVHTIPASEIIVTNLATTGSDQSLMAGGIITAILFMLGGGILFVYNHLTNKEHKK